MSESYFTLPDVPNWRVRLVAVDDAPLSQPIIWFCKLERRKKGGKWITTVLGFKAYGDAFEAAMGAAKAMEIVKLYERKVRAGIVRPFQD